MRRLFRCTINIKYDKFSTHSLDQQQVQKEKWDLLSAVSLERKPILSRQFNELENKFSELLKQIEYEKSHKSNFEIRLENDKKRDEKIKAGNLSITEIDSFSQQTGQDFLDAATEELKGFEFASRTNEKEDTNNKSIKRAMDKYLLLLVNEKIGQKEQWVLPQGKLKEGETLRQTAERVLKEKCGEKINTLFMGNAPCGFYKYRYPHSVRDGTSVGAKIFFFKAQLINGHINLSDGIKDYSWATREELEILSSDYLKSVKMFLIDEEH